MRIQLSVFFSISMFFLSCDSELENSPPVLHKIVEYSLSVIEPSGLTFDEKTSSLWTVSDQTGKVVNIDTSGNVIRQIILPPFDLTLPDLEGITFNAELSELLVINELNSSIVRISASGRIIESVRIMENPGLANNGLEGICYKGDTKNYFLIKENDPKIIIKTDSNLLELERFEVNFSNDLSGIDYDAVSKTLWIVSESSRYVINCNLEGDEIRKYSIDSMAPEGIAIDPGNKKLYIVSDDNSTLGIFSILDY
ncbi:SdiA-regulated domain-containing protein [bacterium]|nr:SdiA-regulated domain-containing protein [bacterium]